MRLLACLLLAACGPVGVSAEVPARDAGGGAVARAGEIVALAARGEERRIGGDCLSACTMHPGLATACFEKGAVLGFHKPRRAGGEPLLPLRFEATSRLMASFHPPGVAARCGRPVWPPGVAAWFMAEARHSRELIRVPGADLIARGEARACP
jgi:hypothetical protein